MSSSILSPSQQIIHKLVQETSSPSGVNFSPNVDLSSLSDGFLSLEFYHVLNILQNILPSKAVVFDSTTSGYFVCEKSSLKNILTRGGTHLPKLSANLYDTTDVDDCTITRKMYKNWYLSPSNHSSSSTS